MSVVRAWSLPPGFPPPGQWAEISAPQGLVSYPRFSARDLAELCRYLRARRDEVLLGRSVVSIAEALGRVGRRLGDSGDSGRSAVMDDLLASTGYSEAMAVRVLDGMARDWTAERLLTLVRMEFGDPEVLDGFRHGDSGGASVRAVGFPLSVHVGAGTVPGVTTTSIVRGLLVKSAVLAKPGLGDTALSAGFVRVLHEEDERLAEAVAVVYWPGGDADLESTVLNEADLVVGYGSNPTLQGLRVRAPITTPVVAYSHRIGFGIVPRSVLTEAEGRSLARATAEAVALFDQKGCVSPHVVFVERGGKVAPRKWAAWVAESLRELEAELPSGVLRPDEVSPVHQLRGEVELRRAAGQDVSIWSGETTPWTVIFDVPAATEPSCLNRVIRIVPVEAWADAVRQIRGFRPFLQSVAVEGGTEVRRAVAEALAPLGVSRVARMTQVAWPPPWWHHDGQGPLRALVRFCDLEG